MVFEARVKEDLAAPKTFLPEHEDLAVRQLVLGFLIPWACALLYLLFEVLSYVASLFLERELKYIYFCADLSCIWYKGTLKGIRTRIKEAFYTAILCTKYLAKLTFIQFNISLSAAVVSEYPVSDRSFWSRFVTISPFRGDVTVALVRGNPSKTGTAWQQEWPISSVNPVVRPLACSARTGDLTKFRPFMAKASKRISAILSLQRQHFNYRSFISSFGCHFS